MAVWSNWEISVVLPAFNEAGNIEQLVDKVAQAFEENGICGEAIIVDDGSTDGTGEQARKMADRYDFVAIESHSRNLGLTKALATGFARARGDVIVFLCADLQSDPVEDIPKLLDGFETGADLVVGWRQGRKEGKKWGSHLYNLTSRLLFKTRIHDQNWVKAFKRECADELFLWSDWHRFMAAIAVYKGFKVAEVKTQWYPRTYGKTKFGRARVVIALLDMLVLKIQMVFMGNPIRFFGASGLACLGLGVLTWMALFVLNRVFGLVLPDEKRLMYFLVSILLMLAGLGSLGLGILGELLTIHIHELMTGKRNGEKR